MTELVPRSDSVQARVAARMRGMLRVEVAKQLAAVGTTPATAAMPWTVKAVVVVAVVARPTTLGPATVAAIQTALGMATVAASEEEAGDCLRD